MILALLMLLAAAGPGAPPVETYAEGQVWDYRTRPGEGDSLLKIQRIETPNPAFDDGGPIFHITIAGARFRDSTLGGLVGHAPVSRETLDASVTRLRANPPVFPSADDGIAEWRRARGGVFTIPVREILDLVDGIPTSAP